MQRNVGSDEPLIYALVDLTFGLAAQTNALVVDVLAKLGLTRSLANALWQLDPAMAAPSMREMASRLRCDPSTVTFLADRLEERGLVMRRVDPNNRRVKTLVLTRKGRQARRRLVETIALHSPIARLSEGEQRELHKLLAKAVGNTAVHT